ncbi:LysR family transcriptional regulator [Paracoccus aurantiacus]|uniref:LysR family transcriptional regulator n=1 Tax=Paracoccus aurantiacus TaxID=2599412 RepID=A0A5C6S7L0_9RHOB|nr:LysR family transcriptional regulator [Paracoccus aurantiacus]TXB70370.1 LysR family transcriptional regulator [Paracoccus aurantiacus]
MTPKRRFLPSLGSMATFEVAAKHLSFTLAATELNVSQAAVSQHIRALEKALETPLFIRKHNDLELTAAGVTLLQSVSQGLDSLCEGIAAITSPEDSAPITCSGTNAVASLWFKPYMDRFREMHPDARFVMLSSDENDGFRNHAEVDLSIICGNERCNMGEQLVYLFPELVQPMCSPEYLRRHGPFATAESLAKADLLELHKKHWSDNAIGWQPYTWENWFDAMEVRAPLPRPSFVSNNYPLLLDAAVNGEGVVIGWSHLTDPLVKAGRLLPLLGAPLQAGRSYYLKMNAESQGRPNVQAFADFIQNDIAKSGANPPRNMLSAATTRA